MVLWRGRGRRYAVYNCLSILLCSVLLIQLESLVLCAFGSSTMMSTCIAILVLEYCKQSTANTNMAKYVCMNDDE